MTQDRARVAPPRAGRDLLVQVGVLDPSSAPMLGVEEARVLTDTTYPLNELITRTQR